jgi:7,8-dihydroneopterin aldolase/epimerase/oxygenase
MTDRVFLHGIDCRCLIGVDADERLGVRPLRIDVDIDTDCREPGHSDEIATALDYRAVAERVQELCAASAYRLIEALAEAIARMILDEFPAASAVRVRIVKPGAVAGVADVGVEIERRWGDLT